MVIPHAMNRMRLISSFGFGFEFTTVSTINNNKTGITSRIINIIYFRNLMINKAFIERKLLSVETILSAYTHAHVHTSILTMEKLIKTQLKQATKRDFRQRKVREPTVESLVRVSEAERRVREDDRVKSRSHRDKCAWYFYGREWKSQNSNVGTADAFPCTL